MSNVNLQAEFKIYLQQYIKNHSGEVSIDDFGSIFSDFLAENSKYSDNTTLFDLDKFDEYEFDDISAFLEEAQSDYDDMSEDEQLFYDIMETMMSFDETNDVADVDGDGKVSSDEMSGFLSTLANKDDDSKTLSFGDFIKGSSDIASGNFEIEASDEVDDASAAGGAGGGIGGGGGLGGGGGDEQNIAFDEQVSEAIKKNLENYAGMDLAQLEQEEATQKSDYETAKTAVQEAMAGTSAEVKTAKDSMDGAYDAFLSAEGVNQELAQQAKDLYDQLSEIGNQINEVNLQVTELTMQKEGMELQVQTFDTQIGTTESTISNLEGNLSQLKSAQSAQASVEPASARVDYSGQIAAVEAQIQEQKTLLEELKTKRDDTKTKIEETTKQIEELSTKINELTSGTEDGSGVSYMGLYQQLTEIEAQICNGNQAAQEKYDAYLQAQQTFSQAQTNAYSVASQNLVTIGCNLQAIENQKIVAEFEAEQERISKIQSDESGEVIIPPNEDDEDEL